MRGQHVPRPFSVEAHLLLAARGGEGLLRLRAIALLHEHLSHALNLTHIDMSAYLHELVTQLFRIYGMERERLTIVLSVEPLALNVETALACGQIVQELLSNCCKHAFPGGRRGTIRLDLHRTPEGRVVLTVSDDGVGLPGGVDVREPDSLGWSLVRLLTDKLGGTILLERGPGTTVRLTFRSA